MPSGLPDLGSMTHHPLVAPSLSIDRADHTPLATDADRLRNPQSVHRFSRHFEQLVHTRVEVDARPLRDVERARTVPSIKTRDSLESRRRERFSTFRELDPKLELRSYFAHGLASSRSIVRHRRRLIVARGWNFDGERERRSFPSYAVSSFDARRRADFDSRALRPAAEDSTGFRSGPAKYHRRASSASRIFRRLSHASSQDRAYRARSTFVPFAVER